MIAERTRRNLVICSALLVAGLVPVAFVHDRDASMDRERTPAHHAVHDWLTDENERLIWIHGYRSRRYQSASEASMTLLNARRHLRSREIDPAIRELAKVLCLGAAPEVQATIAREPIERIYPVPLLGLCKELECGGCETRWRTEIPGPAFLQVPMIEHSPWPSDGELLDEAFWHDDGP